MHGGINYRISDAVVYNYNMLIVNILLALLTFIIIFLLEKLALFLLKKEKLWPLFSYNLLVNATSYTILALLLIGVLHIVFKKVDTISLIWLDIALYFFTR